MGSRLAALVMFKVPMRLDVALRLAGPVIRFRVGPLDFGVRKGNLFHRQCFASMGRTSRTHRGDENVAEFVFHVLLLVSRGAAQNQRHFRDVLSLGAGQSQLGRRLVQRLHNGQVTVIHSLRTPGAATAHGTCGRLLHRVMEREDLYPTRVSLVGGFARYGGDF